MVKYLSGTVAIKRYFHLECAGFLYSGLKYFKSPAAVTLHTLKICRLACFMERSRAGSGTTWSEGSGTRIQT
jgi:hypothetical protein